MAHRDEQFQGVSFLGDADAEPGLGIIGCSDLTTGLLCGLQLLSIFIKNLTNTDRWSMTLNDKDCMKEMNLVSQKKKKKTEISYSLSLKLPVCLMKKHHIVCKHNI